MSSSTLDVSLPTPPLDLPLPTRLALFDRALHRARLRIHERDGFITPHGGYYPRKMASRNYSESFMGGVLMQPVLDCPLDLTKTRSVWQQWDGGKWICGLSYLGRARPCVVYSIGSRFDSSFERDVQRRVRAARGSGAGCDVHIFDPTLLHLSKHGGGEAQVAAFRSELARDRVGTLHLVGLSADANASTFTMTVGRMRKREVTLQARTLEQLMAANGHRCLDVLKVDVDGAESGTLLRTDWRKLCVGVLLLEHHGNLIQRVRGVPYRIGDALREVQQLEAAGLLLYSSEVVCAKCDGQSELAFINVSWARQMVELGPESRQ